MLLKGGHDMKNLFQHVGNVSEKDTEKDRKWPTGPYKQSRPVQHASIQFATRYKIV